MVGGVSGRVDCGHGPAAEPDLVTVGEVRVGKELRTVCVPNVGTSSRWASGFAIGAWRDACG